MTKAECIAKLNMLGVTHNALTLGKHTHEFKINTIAFYANQQQQPIAYIITNKCGKQFNTYEEIIQYAIGITNDE